MNEFRLVSRTWYGARWGLLVGLAMCPRVDASGAAPVAYDPGPDTAAVRAAATTEGVSGSPGPLRQVRGDFESLFTRKENLVLAVAGLGAAWAAHRFDDDIATGRLNSELDENTALDHFFEVGQTLGGGVVQGGGAFATYGLGRLLGSPGVEELGRDLVRAQMVALPITAGIKVAVGRERPDGSNRRAFPSGHTSGTFATATVLQRRYGWKAGLPAYAIASHVAISRLSEGEHYLSDVVFGAAIGLVAGRTVTRDVARARIAFHPTSGGIAARLTWSGSSDARR